jgi:hypothetical protein
MKRFSLLLLLALLPFAVNAQLVPTQPAPSKKAARPNVRKKQEVKTQFWDEK